MICFGHMSSCSIEHTIDRFILYFCHLSASGYEIPFFSRARFKAEVQGWLTRGRERPKAVQLSVRFPSDQSLFLIRFILFLMGFSL